jgi:hypothetical protein
MLRKGTLTGDRKASFLGLAEPDEIKSPGNPKKKSERKEKNARNTSKTAAGAVRRGVSRSGGGGMNTSKTAASASERRRGARGGGGKRERGSQDGDIRGSAEDDGVGGRGGVSRSGGGGADADAHSQTSTPTPRSRSSSIATGAEREEGQHMSAYVSMRQHASAYVIIRQHTYASAPRAAAAALCPPLLQSRERRRS